MKKKSKVGPKVDPYFEGVVGKLIDRLVGLEKKMDVVIAQTAAHKGGGSQQQGKPEEPPRRERQLYEAICADCHKICEVPFRPTEARPVYCKQCFARRKSGGLPHVMPILTPVSVPVKPASKLSAAALSAAAVPAPAPKKAKKASAKKAKKKR